MKYFTPISGGTEIKKTGDGQESSVESDADFRKRLQRMFMNSNKQKFEEIMNALKANDIKLAHRLVHTLKSNSGQIGMSLLQRAASTVEYSLKDGKNAATTEQLNVLERELDSALSQLYVELGPEDGERNAAAFEEPLDAGAREQLFNKLEPMLKMGNPECCSLINSLRRVPQSDTLIRQMENYDFELAAATLAELRGKK